MLEHVISYPDGRVIYFYHDKTVTYQKDENPIERIIMKEKNGLSNRVADLWSGIGSISRH
jgi:hypothetical protein